MMILIPRNPHLLFCRYHDAVKDIYAYTTYGAACSEVEIDILTGEMHVLRSDIVYDCGERFVLTFLIPRTVPCVQFNLQ